MHETTLFSANFVLAKKVMKRFFSMLYVYGLQIFRFSIFREKRKILGQILPTKIVEI